MIVAPKSNVRHVQGMNEMFPEPALWIISMAVVTVCVKSVHSMVEPPFEAPVILEPPAVVNEIVEVSAMFSGCCHCRAPAVKM